MAYAGAGFWMGSISAVVLEAEHVQMRQSCRRRRAAAPVPATELLPSLRRFVRSAASLGLHVLPAVALLFAWSEPVFLQSGLLTAAGWTVVARLPAPARSATVAWGAVVGGCCGIGPEHIAAVGAVMVGLPP